MISVSLHNGREQWQRVRDSGNRQGNRVSARPETLSSCGPVRSCCQDRQAIENRSVPEQILQPRHDFQVPLIFVQRAVQSDRRGHRTETSS